MSQCLLVLMSRVACGAVCGLCVQITSPGGVRNMPSKEQLDAFANACKTLSPGVISGCLDNRLRDSNAKVRGCAISGKSSGTACNPVDPCCDVAVVVWTSLRADRVEGVDRH